MQLGFDNAVNKLNVFLEFSVFYLENKAKILMKYDFCSAGEFDTCIDKSDMMHFS